MNKTSIWAALALIASFVTTNAQQSQAQAEKKSLPLKLTQALPLTGVHGRFDHFTADTANAPHCS